MRGLTRGNGIAAALGLVLWASCAQAEDSAYYRVANVASAGEGNVHFTFNGAGLYKKGYKLGQNSGALAVEVGQHTITAEKDGCVKAVQSFKLEKDMPVTAIAYAVPQLDAKTNEKIWKLKIGILHELPRAKSSTLTVVSFVPRSQLRVQLYKEGGDDAAPSTIELTGSSPERIALGSFRGGFIIALDGEELLIDSMSGGGEHLVLIYQAEDEVMKAVAL